MFVHTFKCTSGYTDPVYPLAVQGFSHQKTPHLADFTHSRFRMCDLQSLLDSIAQNHTTTELCLQDCHLGDKGAEVVAQLLMRNRHIKELYLDENQMTDAGAAWIAKALRVNQSLTHLSIGRNPITEEGRALLLDAIKENDSLYEIDFL